MRLRSLAAALLLFAALGCSDDKSAAGTVAITATDTECRVARTELAAGKTTFRVENKGNDVTEVYVYRHSDEVVTEKENIGPGTTAQFSVELASGHYEIACKPGQKGDGIRQAITVTGAGGPSQAVATKELEFIARDYAFEGGFATLHPKAGDTVLFEMDNTGTVDHEFEVFGPDQKVVGEIGPTKPGAKGSVTLTLPTAGTYRFICDIDDHEARGMKGTLVVS